MVVRREVGALMLSPAHMGCVFGNVLGEARMPFLVLLV